MEEKVIIWGAGIHTDNILKSYYVPMDMIEYVVDANEKLWGSFFWGYQVKSPEIIQSKEKVKSKTIVIGTNKYYQEVSNRLEEMNTGLNVIFIDNFIARFPAKAKATTADYYEKEIMKDLLLKIQDAGSIQQKQMENAKILVNRKEAIKRLPKGGKAAEIGVAYGDFTDIILREMQPDHFYAIDWFHKDNPYICMWGRQELTESGLTHEEWYRNKYKKEIASEKMTVCSGLSWECLSTFEDEYFDFLYIDACHDYESVWKDAEVAVRKIKDGGIIQFNDYTIWSPVESIYYGVVPVVNRVISETGAEVLYYSMHPQGYCDITIKINKNL